jgi:16S rRNA (cytosine967-C5)-methyltransferase
MTHMQQQDLLGDSGDDGVFSRAVALNILSQILGQKKMLDMVIERHQGFLSLPPRDRAFVRMLVATTLRRYGQIEDIVARALDKGGVPRPDSLKWILYLGVTQIMFMDVADHAAVNTSVMLTADQGLDGKKGFVNAILRRIAGAEGKAWLESQDEAALNIPAWLYQQWIDSYGVVRAKNMALASLDEASLDITIKNQNEAPMWCGALEAVELPSGSLRRNAGGHITELPGFDEGSWWVQDASSALPAKLFGDVRGKTVLDLCAAPGGKTAQLAAAGANVVAADRSASRMALLKENIERLKLADNVRTVIEDGSVWSPREQFTHILLDAPCSATGTIRRHPDLLVLKNEKDQMGLISIQERLLTNAAAMLEVGGVLIYCTCSLQTAEGEEQVAHFLNTHRGFRRLPIRKEELGGLDGVINSDGDVRIFPHTIAEEGGMDGFFISRLERNG